MKVKEFIRNLIAALQFITILPVGKNVGYHPTGMIPFFPLAGLILGAILALCDQIFLQFWSMPVASLLDVVLLVIMTGALHVDGLGDAADGMLAHHSRERALTIMKDSRIGVMALVAVSCTLAVKWAGILDLQVQRSFLLFLVPAFSRSTMLFGIKYLPYGRPEGGTGHDLFDSPLPWSSFWGFFLLLILALFLGPKGLWLIFSFFALTAIILFYYKRRLACITGDTLGAMTEISEALLFLLLAMGGAL
jgi:adenosylcobinamide-GDP ribazoletransferase